jgi:peroxiredoxin Q/BCP
MADDYSDAAAAAILAPAHVVVAREKRLYCARLMRERSRKDSTMLEVGKSAPEFTLPDADMEMVSLAEFRDKNHVVLYFYPKDDTPGCTREAIDFSDLEGEFTEQQAVVLGVSRDDCLSHGAFRDKHGLAVRLLSDADAEACEKYGVLQEKEVEGVRRVGISRSTFVIDKHGMLRHVLYGVKAAGHAQEVLGLVRRLKK